MGNRVQLDHQADRIEATLASHKIRTHVAGGMVTPRFIRFDLLPEPGTRIRSIHELAEELALSLNASRCRVFAADLSSTDYTLRRFRPAETADAPADRLFFSSWLRHGICTESKRGVKLNLTLALEAER